METNTLISYTEKINNLLPNATIVKLIGYSNGNADYQIAKKAADSWKQAKTLSDDEINYWLSVGGWIGAVIPEGRYLIDIDDPIEGKLLKELLENENVRHHLIKTPNGYQFIFKGESPNTIAQGQYQKYVNRLGLTQDSRAAGKGYIVFPTYNTKGRYILTESINELSELPRYLYKVWNAEKTPSPMSYPYESDGSRNADFYDLARRLFTCNVSYDDVLEALELAYKYFVPYKNGFTFEEIKKSIKSAYNKVNEGKKEPFVNECQLENLTVIIPKPYKVVGSDFTLYEEKQDKNGNITLNFVSRKTPFVTKEFQNIERPQVFYEVEWKDRNRTIKVIVPASTLAVRKELLTLSEKGFSVNENNVKKLISYFDQYLLLNNIEQHNAVERLGQVKDKFIHPLLTKDIEIIAIDEGEAQIKEAFEIKGTFQSWKKEVFERIKDSPKAVFMVLASFASVIIGDLSISPFIVDLSGSTSQGKTTTLKVASTVWGNEKLMNEWNATRVSIERKAAYLNNFPLLMDDTRKANEKVLKDVVYQFSGGRSKGRGSVKGSQREYTWKNILLSTGEVSLNEYAKNQGGVAARIIPLVDEPLKKDYENISNLHQAMEKNYGTAGIEFLKVWLNKKQDFIHQFPIFKKHYIDKARGNEVLTRIASYYASVHFVGKILKETLGLDIDLKSISALFDEIAEENKNIDKPMQLLEEILTDLDSSRADIYTENDSVFFMPKEIKAIHKKNQLYLMPSYLGDFLGAEERQIRREWLKRGITVAINDKGKIVDYKSIKHNGKTYRAIPLNMKYVEELGFNFEENN